MASLGLRPSRSRLCSRDPHPQHQKRCRLPLPSPPLPRSSSFAKAKTKRTSPRKVAQHPPLDSSSSRLSSSLGKVPDVWSVSSELQESFHEQDLFTSGHVKNVLRSFAKHRLASHHVLSNSNGYGIGDVGREVLDLVAADLWQCEAAVVRANLVSGTHAISCGLFGACKPGTLLMSCTGSPYDTLEEVLGVRQTTSGTQNAFGTLLDWGVQYCKVDLLLGNAREPGSISLGKQQHQQQEEEEEEENGSSSILDWEGIEENLVKRKPQVVFVQRSCGYRYRPTLSIEDIKRLVSLVRSKGPKDCRVLVDNCYGEFVEEVEPVHSTEVGADLMMGSLIKSPGGTIVPCGGYIAGRAELVANAVSRLTVPGAGSDNGAHLGSTNRLLLQGLFMAPHAVGEALKASRLIAHVMHDMGYEVLPPKDTKRRDYVTAIKLGTEEDLLAFCEAVQEVSPVNSFVKPVPGDTPGYGDPVVFADGTFVGGSTGEMTCDGPLREPYVVFCQGGTHWTQWAIALENVLHKLLEKKHKTTGVASSK